MGYKAKSEKMVCISNNRQLKKPLEINLSTGVDMNIKRILYQMFTNNNSINTYNDYVSIIERLLDIKERV